MFRTRHHTVEKPLERGGCLRNYTQKTKLKKTSSLRRSTEIEPRKSTGKKIKQFWKKKSEKIRENYKRGCFVEAHRSQVGAHKNIT